MYTSTVTLSSTHTHTHTQISCCDMHCAAVSTTGKLYTFGGHEGGKLGRPHGDSVSWEVTRFMSSDEQNEIENVKIDYVSH